MAAMGERSAHGKLKVGAAAPDFELPGVDGARHARKRLLAGKKGLVVVFTCNHCPYVKAYEKRTLALARATLSKGIAWVGVCANDASTHPDDSFPAMKLRAVELDLPYPYLHDESQAVARAFDAAMTPEYYLLDAGGVLRYHGRLDDEMEETRVTRRYLADAIEAVLAGRAPAPAETYAVGCTVKWKR